MNSWPSRLPIWRRKACSSAADVFLIRRALAAGGISASISVAINRQEFVSALDAGQHDLILADNAVPGLGGCEAIKLVEEKSHGTPVICVSGGATEERALATLEAGAANYVLKDQLWQLVAAVRTEQEKLCLARLNQGMARVVSATQELSAARELDAVMKVVTRAARETIGADGATFALREGDWCYYAEEDAFAPLWKGQRVALEACISGWVMLNRRPAVIEDPGADARICADTHLPTLVKTLAVVPIHPAAPIGALGSYWARQCMPTAEDVQLLRVLADTAVAAMDNVRVYRGLEQRVKEGAEQLVAANREWETLSCALSHELAAPLRTVRGFSDLVLKEKGQRLDGETKDWLEKIRAASADMENVISALVQLSKISRATLKMEQVNLSEPTD